MLRLKLFVVHLRGNARYHVAMVHYEWLSAYLNTFICVVFLTLWEFNLFSQCAGEGKDRSSRAKCSPRENATSGNWSSCFLYQLMRQRVSCDVQLQLLFFLGSEVKVKFAADVADTLLFWSDIFDLRRD